MKINKYFDHTLLKPDATRAQILELIQEAKDYDFMSVCVNPTWVTLAKKELNQTDVKVCTVIGFPLGATTSASKAFEAAEAKKNGADEIDMVLNIGLLKSGELNAVKEDIKAVVDAVPKPTLVKVIIETCLLSDTEKEIACRLTKEAGADFVKTSTGFSTGGATVSDVKLMHLTVGPNFGVKASGGVKNISDVKKMIEAGANRIGTSSGVKIISEQEITEDTY